MTMSVWLQKGKANAIQSWHVLVERTRTFLTNRNNYLLILFCIYLVLLPCFALIYYKLYRGNRRRFAFNQDIARAQQQIVKASTEHEIGRGKRLVDELRYLSTYLTETKTPQLQSPRWFENYILKIYGDQYHYECSVTVVGGGGPGGVVQTIPFLVIRKTDGQELDRFNLPNGLHCPNTLDEAKQFATNVLSTFEQELAQNQTYWASLEEEAPEVWSYWDFVYFSTVTQTTVGYGDIVPNSTSVRIIVVVQLVLGTALLVVGLNFVLRGKNRQRSASTSEANTKMPLTEEQDADNKADLTTGA